MSTLDRSESASPPSPADEPAGERKPFLRADGLALGGFVSPSCLEVERGPVLCLGEAAGLIRLAVEPGPGADLLLVCGVPVRQLLRSGKLGYCPLELPAAGGASVFTALRASARLIGVSGHEVHELLALCGLSAVAKHALSSLTKVEQRLVGIAHGLCGDPAFLFVEDLLSDLDDLGAQRVDELLVRVLAQKTFVMGGSAHNLRARLWWRRVEALLRVEDGELQGPFAPSSVVSTSHFVTTLDSADSLSVALSEAGVRVARTPNENSLFVLATAEIVIEHAVCCGAKIVALTPTEHGPFLHEHARSGP